MRLALSSLFAVFSAALHAPLVASPQAGTGGFAATALGNTPDRPTSLAFAPGEPGRLYVATKRGRIWIFENGNYNSTPFLDIRADVNDAGEGGLLGFVFDPDFLTNRHFYLAYNTGAGFGDSIVSRFTAPTATPGLADPSSEEIIWGPYPQQSDGHKGGDLEFGPDGMLYHALGDGDAGSSQGLGTAQDLGDARGKILRFDVEAAFPHVPGDNPFVNTPGAEPHVWARGFRNPWRFDIDPVTGDLYVADVGTSIAEEITRLPAGVGGLNGGWPCVEGFDCRTHAACVCTDPGLTDPIAVFGHGPPDNFCSLTGGVLYRGSAIPSIAGQFLYADFCTGTYGGVVDPAGSPTINDLSANFLNGGQPIRFAVDFARDLSGEVWLAEHYSGRIYHLDPAPGFVNFCSTNANSSGAPASIAASGSPSINAGDLTLTVSDLPQNQFGFFLTSREAAFVPNFAGSQGNLCLGAPLYRWIDVVYNTGSMNSVTRTTDFSDLPFGVSIAPGETWSFQYWTRDVNPTGTSNTSDAVVITFGQ